MTYVHDSLLPLEVATRNKVNAKANYLSQVLRELFAEFEGKKIVKFTPYKYFTAKITKRIDEIKKQAAEEGFRLWFNIQHGSISAELDTTYRRDDVSVNYVKQYFYLASYTGDSGLMLKTYNAADFRTDYTDAEILAKREQINKLDAAMRELKSDIREFT